LLVNCLISQNGRDYVVRPFTLTNGENRRSLSGFYQELCKKWWMAIFKKSDNSLMPFFVLFDEFFYFNEEERDEES
jgi:hypothetical protein